MRTKVGFTALALFALIFGAAVADARRVGVGRRRGVGFVGGPVRGAAVYRRPNPLVVAGTAAAVGATAAVVTESVFNNNNNNSRKLLSESPSTEPAALDDETEMPESDSDQSNENEKDAEDQVDPSNCPVDVAGAIGDGLDFLKGKCGADADNFCSDCLMPAREKLHEVASARFDQDSDALERARADPDAVAACGQALLNVLEERGILESQNDALWEKIDECAAAAPAAAEAACPIDAATFEKNNDDSAIKKLGASCLDVFHDATENENDIDANAYCSNCYWAILKLLVNNGAMSDEFWCTFKDIGDNDSTGGAITPEGEANIFAAMQDDKGFRACAEVARNRLIEMDENEDGSADDIDALDNFDAAKKQKECWTTGKKPAQGSILSDDNRSAVAALQC